MKYTPIIFGNNSPADDLFDMGKALAKFRRCNCDGCSRTITEMTDTYREEIIELAEAWYALSHEQIGTVFQGLVDGWDEAKCAEACGLTYDYEREAA